MDSIGGSDPDNIFPLFLMKIADFISSKLAKIFRALLTSGSFLESWRIANVTPIPKGSTPVEFPLEYRPISITPIILKIFEKLIERRLYKFANSEKKIASNSVWF